MRKPFLRHCLRSFRSFRNPAVATGIGCVVVRGDATPATDDDVSGSISIEAPSASPGSGWRENADGLLRHLHYGLAFAHGGRLQTPMVEFVEGERRRVTFFAGTGFTSELPVQHHLYHEPFIRALVARYETLGPLPDMLWTALGWMQSDTTIDEMRFLTTMTAIEAIVESQLPSSRGTIIPKQSFSTLRKTLEQIVSRDERLDQTAREIFAARIAGVNQKSLSGKIDALFDHYGMSRRDFEGSAILNLIKVRNEIIHKGLAPPSHDLWLSIILVRELITRTCSWSLCA